MNNVCLIGRLTRDPELRTTTNGASTTTFSIAVDGYRNANGETHTDFINIVVWNKQAENVVKYVHKGSQVGINGRISSRSYTAQDGTTRYVTEVVASSVTFLGSRNDGTGSTNESDSSFDSAPTADFSDDQLNGFEEDVTLSDDDELPF